MNKYCNKSLTKEIIMAEGKLKEYRDKISEIKQSQGLETTNPFIVPDDEGSDNEILKQRVKEQERNQVKLKKIIEHQNEVSYFFFYYLFNSI